MTRLKPHAGEWIDRSEPMEFRFEGRTYLGFKGDVVTSALWANGVRMVGRSFKYHRPRGTYSLAGHDVNAMFEDGQRTNLRGDTMPLADGLDLRSVNTAGGLARDWLRFRRIMLLAICSSSAPARLDWSGRSLRPTRAPKSSWSTSSRDSVAA